VVFRRHDSGSAERLETGYEDIGRPDRVAADAEALALALRGVAALGDGTLVTHLGDIGLFVAVLVALGLPEPWRRRLRRSFGVPALMTANLDRLSASRPPDEETLDAGVAAASAAHDRGALVAILQRQATEAGYGSESGRSPAEIADRFLDRQALSETRIDAGTLRALNAFLALAAPLSGAPDALRAFAAAHRLDLEAGIAAFADRAAAIHARVPDAGVRFVAGFGRPLDYYTGLVFEVRSEGYPYPIAGGGRYDRLMEMLGAREPVPAVGFTIRLDEPARRPR
jgi:ATP phosphoribosyltransferase regulatory subunit